MQDNLQSSKKQNYSKGNQGKTLENMDIENKSLLNEVEHLKNTLIGLNEKLTVFNDLKKDLEQSKTMHCESEFHRVDL